MSLRSAIVKDVSKGAGVDISVEWCGDVCVDVVRERVCVCVCVRVFMQIVRMFVGFEYNGGICIS